MALSRVVLSIFRFVELLDKFLAISSRVKTALTRQCFYALIYFWPTICRLVSKSNLLNLNYSGYCCTALKCYVNIAPFSTSSCDSSTRRKLLEFLSLITVFIIFSFWTSRMLSLTVLQLRSRTCFNLVALCYYFKRT